MKGREGYWDVRVYVAPTRITVYSGYFEWKDFKFVSFPTWKAALDYIGDQVIRYVRVSPTKDLV